MFQAVLPELVQLGPDHIAELTLAYIQQQQKQTWIIIIGHLGFSRT